MPSLATESPLDYRVKKGLVVDVMKKLALNVRRKHTYKLERKARLTDNLMQPRSLVDNSNKPDDKGDFKEDQKHDDIKKIEEQ